MWVGMDEPDQSESFLPELYVKVILRLLGKLQRKWSSEIVTQVMMELNLLSFPGAGIDMSCPDRSALAPSGATFLQASKSRIKQTRVDSQVGKLST